MKRVLQAALVLLVLAAVSMAGLVGLAPRSRPGLAVRFALARATGGAACRLEVPGVPAIDMFLDPDSVAFTPILLRRQIWEPEETRLFVEAARAGAVVADVGANVGYYTLLAAQIVGPSGRVYAFEPDPESFRFLEDNVRLNGFDNVTLVQKAASNENGSTTFYADDNVREDGRIYDPDARGTRYQVPGAAAREAFEVETVRLDDYFAGREKHLDILKIDTQGAEGAIVDGAMGIAGGTHPIVMFVEFSPEMLRDMGWEPAQLLGNLSKLGVDFHMVRARGPLPTSPESLMANLVDGKRRSANLYLTRDGAGGAAGPRPDSTTSR